MPEREEKTSHPADHADVHFRSFEQGDISACARLAADAWPPGPGIVTKELELSSMKGYMEYSAGLANWTEIAYTSEGVVGLLFGRIDNHHGTSKPKEALLGELPTFLRSFFVKDRLSVSSVRFFWGLFLTELKLKLRMPKSDASIVMFIVYSSHRGKGIGGELVGRFLRAAKDTGSTLVTVYTDDITSNWQFYERRGFKRVGTFHDNVTSYYSGKYARGIIFALDLRERERQDVGV
jgi:GNAT superfamily N-acetyltransferase